ncbi:hypothetical protein J4474_04220 [Candidatus Pacearchaeota archaeon]|nr:hypothetical protein [Candidatus Pacearchaeota archaeon]
MNKKRVMGIFLSWIGLAIILISFSPSVTGFAISSSLIFRGGYFLFLGFVLAIVGMFMTTLEDEVEDETDAIDEAMKYHSEDFQIVATKTVSEIHSGKYDTLVFLDESARVYQHLIRARWKVFYPNERMPPTFFVNIGREKWKRPWYDREGKEYYRKNFSRMKKQYSKKVLKGFNKKYFENKRILILDEFKSTGKSGRFVKEVFKDAFPDSKVKYFPMGEYFMNLNSQPISETHKNKKTDIFISPVDRNKPANGLSPEMLESQYQAYRKMARKLKEIGERKY